MRPEPSCPRCGGRVQPPGLMSSDWQCDRHGPVPPLQAPLPPSRAAADRMVAESGVPVWVVWPLPPGWLVTGFGLAGDDRAGARASVVALS